MKFQRLLGVFSVLIVTLLSGCGSLAGPSAPSEPLVVVAGATGGTGRALVSNLQDQGYRVRAFVRDTDKARVVLGDSVDYAEGDVREIETITAALKGADYLISSIGSSRSDPANNPEAVDFRGVKNLADAAAQAGLRQFVLVSSSGVTHEDHFLNKVMDNVLKWKFQGEEAVRASGVPYTIVRPGGLVNAPGGKDELMMAQGDTTSGTINREDVALICIAALGNQFAVGKTFETYSSEKPGANNWDEKFSALKAD